MIDCLPVVRYYIHMHLCLRVVFLHFIRWDAACFRAMQGGRGSIGRSCDPWNVAPCKLIQSFRLLLLSAIEHQARDACRRAMPRCWWTGARATPSLWSSVIHAYRMQLSFFFITQKVNLHVFVLSREKRLIQRALAWRSRTSKGFTWNLRPTLVYYKAGYYIGPDQPKLWCIKCNRVGGLSRSSQSTKQI